MRYIVEIPNRYKTNHILNTTEIFGYGVESMVGGDVPYLIGKDILLSDKVYLYKLVDGLSEHVLISREKIDPKDIKKVDPVCIYSKYYFNNKAPIICRYLRSYSKVLSWITEDDKPVNSIWFDYIEHPYNVVRDDPIKEEFFITFSDIDVISLLTSDYIVDNINNHYKTNQLFIPPNILYQKENLNKYLDRFYNYSKIIKPDINIDSNDHRLLKGVNIDDAYIINLINTIPIRSCSCIYHTNIGELVIKNLELITMYPIDIIIKTLKNILSRFDFDDEIYMYFFNEEINIKSKRQNLYINVPIVDLCNHLFKSI